MKRTKKDAKTKNAYKPSGTLTKYLEEKLQLLKLEQESTMRGKPLSNKDRKKKELNQRKRVHVLNHHIFESMANLVYFFEFASSNPVLLDEFENEIEELLMGWNKNSKLLVGSYFATSFARLIFAATRWNYGKKPLNFRLTLFYIMQSLIALRITDLAKMDFDKDAGPLGVSETIIKSDMDRATAWAGLYHRNTWKSETQKDWEDCHRPVLF